jgi:hypothetical protein
MAALQHDSKGACRARKRLPDDARDEYSRISGARFAAKFSRIQVAFISQ